MMATSKPKTDQTAASRDRTAALARSAKHPRPANPQRSGIKESVEGGAARILETVQQVELSRSESSDLGQVVGEVDRRDPDESTAPDQANLEGASSRALRILFEELLVSTNGRMTGLEFSIQVKPIAATTLPDSIATKTVPPRRRTALELASDLLQNPGPWLRTPNSQLGNRKPIDLIGTPEEEKVYYLLNAVDLGLF